MSDEYRVLVSCPLIQDSIESYDELFENHGVTYDDLDVDQQLTEEDLLEVIGQYHGVIAGDDEFTRAVFEAAENLQVVSKWGIGVDSIDFDAAKDHGVAVHNTPGAFADEVADMVIGYAIMLTRHLHNIDSGVREGEWPCLRGVSLRERTFGVLGVGNIGSAVARRAAAHGMNVIGHDVQPIPEDLRTDIGIESATVDELFENSDIVSLNCALTPETEGIVDETKLEALGSEGYLINTARGRLVDEYALVDALQNGDIAGAALDVYETEPIDEHHPLTQFENVVLGTHNAQNTEEAVQAVNDRAVENLLDELT